MNPIRHQQEHLASERAGLSELLAGLPPFPRTKLTVPRRPSHCLSRPALIAKAQQWQRHRLTVITAPAGYGKTTLVASLLQIAPQPSDFRSCWLALDENDDDPARFVFALSVALLPCCLDAAQVAVHLAMHQNEPRRALSLLLAALEQDAGQLLVVLDDFHRLQQADVHQLFMTALEQSPQNLHWMVLMRPPQRLRLARLRLAREVLELTAEDLRLTRSELTSFLELMGQTADDQTLIDLLETHTQGWLAALHLFLLSTPHVADAAPHSLARGLSIDNVVMTEYLTSEVLAHLEEPLRSFLLQTSILDRLHPDLCRTVTGRADSRLLLQQALAQQLFLRELNLSDLRADEDSWYEQHQLFREFLRRHLLMEESAAAIEAIHRRAADWHLAQNDVVSALRLLIAGNAPHLAAEVVQNRSRTAILTNHTFELRQWLSLLPEAVIQTRPQLVLDRTWLSLDDIPAFAATFEQTRSYLVQMPILRPEWQDELTTLAFLHRYLGDVRDNIHQEMLDEIATFDKSSHLARGYAYFIAAATVSQQAGGFAEQKTGALIESYTALALSAFGDADFKRGQLLVLALRTLHALHALDGDAVITRCQQALQIIAQQEHSDPDDSLYFLFSAGEALYWQNRLTEAAAYFRRALSEALTYRYANYILQSQAALHLCEVHLGLTPGIVQGSSLDEKMLWSELLERSPLGPRAWVVLWQIRCGMAYGALQSAMQYLDYVGVSLEEADEEAPDSVWLPLLTVRVMAGERLESLTPIFDRLQRRYQGIEFRYYLIQLQVLRTLQLKQLGLRDAARAALSSVLPDVEYTGYVRMVLDYPDLVPVLRRIKSEYARSLIDAIERKGANAAAQTPQIALSGQENAILGLLIQGLTTEEISQYLVISSSTVRSTLSRLYKKIGVKNKTQAAAWAQRQKLLTV